MTRRHLAVLAAGVALAGGPAPAQAATARLHVPPCSEGEGKYGNCPPPQIVVDAAPGEANDVAVVRSAETFRVRDAAAPLTGERGCWPLGPHEAECPAGLSATVRLGDRDDRMTVEDAFGEEGPVGPTGPAFRADAGPGADVLAGGDAGEALSGGGGGRDVVSGGGGADGIGDGDGIGAADDDVLDGGTGFDRVGYGDRLSAVTVDLATGRGGTALEADRITGVEAATGGAGPDRLSGDDGQNALSGGDGRDVLAGRGGRDALQAADSDADTAIGGPGDDSIESIGPRTRISCGEGTDIVEALLQLPVRVPEDCERAGGSSSSIDLHLPLADLGAPIATLPEQASCQGCWTSGGIKVRAVGGRHAGRLVAGVALRPRLNALGRRLLRAHGRLTVDVRAFRVWVRVVLRPRPRPAAPSGGA